MQEISLFDDTEEFLGKWRGRWPEWRIARIFVDPTLRDLAEAWFALLQEFVDAAWGGEDATPGAAKLSWWQDELRGWSKGARRHPLGAVLQKIPAPWPDLAQSLMSLQAARDAARKIAENPMTQASAEAFSDSLRPCAAAISACEAVLFVVADAVETSHEKPRYDGSGGPQGMRLVALHALWTFADRPGLARPDLVRALLANGPGLATNCPRRIYDALIRQRLRAIVAGGDLAPLSPWSTLWTAWRAARR
jgi:hypothetical protein